MHADFDVDLERTPVGRLTRESVNTRFCMTDIARWCANNGFDRMECVPTFAIDFGDVVIEVEIEQGTMKVDFIVRGDNGVAIWTTASHIDRHAMPRGGERWVVSCPSCERWTRDLYFDREQGIDELVCRRCAGVAYQSARSDKLQRAVAKAKRARAEFDGRSFLDPLRPRTVGEHVESYARAARQVVDAHQSAVDEATVRYELLLAACRREVLRPRDSNGTPMHKNHTAKATITGRQRNRGVPR